MISFEAFSAIIHTKTEKRRLQRGLKKVTKPQMKKAYKRLTTEDKFANMNEDKQISYFIGWFLLD